MIDMLLRGVLGGMRKGPEGPRRPGKGGCSARIFLALIMVAVAFASFYGSTHEVENKYTGEKQRVLRQMTVDQEVAMGLAAVPEMKKQHGGDYPDPRLQQEIDRIGFKLLERVGETPFQFEFHLLKDPKTVNAFALPGGQVFMTYGLWKMLDETGRAGVIGHEIGHVLARHSAEQMAVAVRNQAVAGAAGVLVSSEGGQNPMVAGMVNQILTTRHGRDDEYQADALGVQIMLAANYDPHGLLKVMEVLAQAGGGGRGPEFLSTHPNPVNRAQKIKDLIARYSGRSSH